MVLPSSIAPRAAVVIALAAVGCAPPNTTVPRTPVALVTSGDERVADLVRRAATVENALPVEVRVAALPETPASVPPDDGPSARLALARRSYVDADFARCISTVGDDAMLTDLLAAGQREVAARVLLWRVACHVGASDASEAARAAGRLAALGLNVPSDVSAVAPEVDATLTAAQRATSEAPRVSVRLTADVPGAAVAIDGRAPACTTPCDVDLPPGDHVVRLDADGVEPLVRVVRAEGARVDVAFATTPASPALAARQWAARYARSAAIDSPSAVRLLARAAAARHVLLVSAVPERRGTRLRAVLATGGVVAARVDRVAREPGGEPGEARALLREVFVRGGVVIERPLHASPVFWATLGVAVAATTAATITAAVLYPVPTRTVVTF